MMPYDTMTFERRFTTLETWAMKIRSNVHRSAEREIRASRWRDYHGGRRPRHDDEIAVAWMLRKLRNRGGLYPHGYPVTIPGWEYVPYPQGPMATQIASVRCLVAKDQWEREYFVTITRLPDDMHTFAYLKESGNAIY